MLNGVKKDLEVEFELNQDFKSQISLSHEWFAHTVNIRIDNLKRAAIALSMSNLSIVQ